MRRAAGLAGAIFQRGVGYFGTDYGELVWSKCH